MKLPVTFEDFKAALWNESKKCKKILLFETEAGAASAVPRDADAVEPAGAFACYDEEEEK